MKPKVAIRIGQFSLGMLLLPQGGFSQAVTWQGQLSSWAISTPEVSLFAQAGFRYIPALSARKTLAENVFIDAEFSLNAFSALSDHRLNDDELDGKIKAYRAWTRLATNRFEARLGLQKINFGSATLFRPLRWFDRIDPRDPLQLTNGVYGLLLRYYFPNNVNLWFWGLYGNDETKGWEIAPTRKKRPELGGRLQTPLLTGEIGLTWHHRKTDFTRVEIFDPVFFRDESVPENRFGLDGKWDVGVGAWVEGAVTRRETNAPNLRFQRFWTAGVDYTFGVGNGLNAIFEYFNTVSSNEFFGDGVGASFSALSLNYALGLVDNLSAIFFYDWKNRDLYRTAILRRLYDNWSFYFFGFWNPDAILLNRESAGGAAFTGKGAQVMVVFNH